MKNMTLLALSLSSLLAGKIAYADDNDSLEGSSSFDHHVAAPANALELAVATGYTQGAGPIAGGTQHVEDVSKAGGAVEVDAMYRINPTFAIGAYGSFSKYATGDQINDQTDVLGATAGIQAAAHLRPVRCRWQALRVRLTKRAGAGRYTSPPENSFETVAHSLG